MKTGISLTSIVRVLCDRIRSVRGSHASGLVKHTTFGTVFEPLETRLLLDATILGPAEFNWTIEPQIVQIYQHPSNSGDEPPDFGWDFNINDGLKPEAARVEILQSTPQIIEGHVYIPGLAHFERNVDGVDYTIFELSEHVNGGNVGQAQLPTIRTFFEVPDNVNISWKITPELVLDLGDSFTMFPVQPNQS